MRDCFETIVHPEDTEKVRGNAINMLKGKVNSSYEFRIIDGNGQIRWLLERVTSISYRGKRAVLGNAIDITDRKKAEDAQNRSEESTRRLAEESGVLAEIGRIISSTLNIEEVYQLFSEKVKTLIPYDLIAVNLMKKDAAVLVNRYVEGESAPGRDTGDEFSREGTLTEAVIQKRRGLIIDGQNENEIAAGFPGLMPEFKAGFRSFMSVPLLSRDQPVGGLHFRSKGCRTYSEKDLKLAESIAAQIAGTIASAELFAELKKTQLALKQSEEAAKKLARENATMAEIARILYSDFDAQAFYDRFAAEVRKLIHFDRISIGMLNPDGSTLTISYVQGDVVPGRRRGDVIPIRGTVAEDVIPNRSSLFISEADLESYINRFPAFRILVDAGFRSFILVPLLAKERVMGVIYLMSSRADAYVSSDLRLAEKLGTLLGGAIANVRLFTELQEAEKALRTSEEKYRLLVQNANDAIFIIQGGVIKFSNRQTEILFGYSARELAALPFLNLILPDDREYAQGETVAGFRGEKYHKPRSFRIGNKEGKERWVELKTIDIEWDGKAATLNFAGDITEQKKLEAQFLQAQKMEAVGQLAGGVAHDFNNLLTVINTHSQLALQELKEWDPLREKFQAIETAGQRAANLTKQLLAFSRRQVVAMKVLSLNEIVRDLEKMLRRLIGEDIILTTKLDQNLGRIKADSGQIEQVIFNLVVNARDAMPKGGRLDILTSNEILDDQYSRTHMGILPSPYIMLSVSDNGVGIHPKIRERIFDPFFTTKEKGKGTGLGLSTVYGIVKQTGGDISVYSEPARGTTFKIYLPQVGEPLDRPAEEGASGKTPPGHETILIVEDEEEVRKLAAEILGKHGYRVLVASSGEDALLLCEKQNGPIHLLLSDVIMPEISGPEFARRLKILLPEMKSLFMSGFPDNALHQNGLLEQGVNFLQKPFSVDGLTKRVREVLDS